MPKKNSSSTNKNNKKDYDIAKNRESGSDNFMSTNQGLKINDDQNSLKSGERGASLLEDFILREKITHFDHERIPERIVPADLNIPGNIGYECLREIRGTEKLKDIYISMYSTSDSEKDIEDAFRNGANMYVTKPSDFELLKKVLLEAVRTGQQ